MTEHEKTPCGVMDRSQLSTEQHSERPLVTFALFAYNQEKFIREAVAGALAQTYSPLQIIFSDDCSTDKTYDIMQDEVNGYRGPHRIILNRNSSNLGIGAHINKISDMADGIYVLAAAGDDISLPSRTEETWKAFTSHPDCKGFYTPLICITESGDTTKTKISLNRTSSMDILHAIQNFCPGVLGASHAWHRDIFDVFGPMHPGVICEDRVLPLREALLGNIYVSSTPLVRYRVHSGGISQGIGDLTQTSYLNRQHIMWKQTIYALRNYRQDILTWSSRSQEFDRQTSKQALLTIDRLEHKATLCTALLSQCTKRRQIKTAVKLLIATRDIKLVTRMLLLRLFPKVYFYRLKRVMARSAIH